MRLEAAEVFVALDGRRFLTRAECLNHEAGLADTQPYTLLAGSTGQELLDAINLEPGSEVLGDAIERAGAMRAKNRRAKGLFRRPRRGDGAEAELPTAAD